MKRIILIGTIGCGKSTLGRALLGKDLHANKTQAIEVLDNRILDTPGEYLERAKMRGALMVTSADADLVLLLQSPTDERCMYPPGYGGAFAKEAIGVVTKCDAADETQRKRAEDVLRTAGAKRIFFVSSYTGAGSQS